MTGKDIFSLLLSPRGRIGQKTFIMSVIVLLALVYGQRFIYPLLGTGMGQFFGGMIFFFVNFHILLCVFGKRLHDLGRSLWPLVTLIVLTIVVAIIVMLNFGGMEYFNTLYKNPQIAQDAEAMQALHTAYQTSLAEARPLATIFLGILPLLFVVWLAVSKGEAADNRYGPPV